MVIIPLVTQINLCLTISRDLYQDGYSYSVRINVKNGSFGVSIISQSCSRKTIIIQYAHNIWTHIPNICPAKSMLCVLCVWPQQISEHNHMFADVIMYEDSHSQCQRQTGQDSWLSRQLFKAAAKIHTSCFPNISVGPPSIANPPSEQKTNSWQPVCLLKLLVD